MLLIKPKIHFTGNSPVHIYIYSIFTLYKIGLIGRVHSICKIIINAFSIVNDRVNSLKTFSVIHFTTKKEEKLFSINALWRNMMSPATSYSRWHCDLIIQYRMTPQLKTKFTRLSCCWRRSSRFVLFARGQSGKEASERRILKRETIEQMYFICMTTHLPS